MACNCIEEKEAKLQKDTGDDEAFIDAFFNFDKKIWLFNIKAFYRKKIIKIGKKELFSKNFSIAHISFNYCPFCGKKYIEEADRG